MPGYQYPKLKVDSPNLKYTTDQQGHEQLESLYEYEHVRVERVPEEHTIKVSLCARTRYCTTTNIEIVR